MKQLHKRENTTAVKTVGSKEGERTLLCSNESSGRSPSLDFLDTSADNVTEDQILEYLARIIWDMYLRELYGEQKGSDLLPCLNKRTG